MQLYTRYKMRNGETIVFNGVSLVNKPDGSPIDIFTSGDQDGQWNKKGQYLTNVYFLEGKPSEMDVMINGK